MNAIQSHFLNNLNPNKLPEVSTGNKGIGLPLPYMGVMKALAIANSRAIETSLEDRISFTLARVVLAIFTAPGFSAQGLYERESTIWYPSTVVLKIELDNDCM